MDKTISAKYEFHPTVVQYLMDAVNEKEVRGAGAARDLLNVIDLLQNPLNKKEFEGVESPKKK